MDGAEKLIDSERAKKGRHNSLLSGHVGGSKTEWQPGDIYKIKAEY